jgi:hypothetical protein
MIKRLSIALIYLSLPITTLAQGIILDNTPNPGLPGKIKGDNTTGTFSGTVYGIIQIVLSVVGLIAVAYIIYGGFRYVTSAGDEKAVGEAKKTILNAIIGLIVVILSYVLVRVVTNATFGHI